VDGAGTATRGSRDMTEGGPFCAVASCIATVRREFHVRFSPAPAAPGLPIVNGRTGSFGQRQGPADEFPRDRIGRGCEVDSLDQVDIEYHAMPFG